MYRVLEDLEPKDVFYHFEEISKIPHGSGNERQISDYIVAFARERGYDAIQDGSYNVVVNLPGTPGYETRNKIILQGHIDMVCQKEPGVEFDFKKDPLQLYIDGEYIRAKHTTLGADDGFAVAMMLSIMDAKDLPHAPLQMIFTTEEEVGGTGAANLDGSLIDGKYYIGLDCSQDNIVMVSCAGISASYYDLPANRIPLDISSKEAFTVSIGGLRGGHSGNMIHLGRANSIKVLGEGLAEIANEVPVDIISFTGGTVGNVIPVQATATVCCDQKDSQKLSAALEHLGKRIRAAFLRTDPDILLTVTAVAPEDIPSTCLDKQTVKTLLNLIQLSFSGMRTAMDDSLSLAESSTNMGVLEETDGMLRLRFRNRSNSEYHHDNLLNNQKVLADVLQIKYVLESRFRSWEYNPDSQLMLRISDVYEQLNGEAPIIKKIHASVESTVIIEKMHNRGIDLDVVNIGCNNLDVHTPNERLQISSVGKTYSLLKRILCELD